MGQNKKDIGEIMEGRELEYEFHVDLPFDNDQVYIVGYCQSGSGDIDFSHATACRNNEEVESEIYTVVVNFDIDPEEENWAEDIVIAEWLQPTIGVDIFEIIRRKL